jgi:hypothetical protein
MCVVLSVLFNRAILYMFIIKNFVFDASFASFIALKILQT